MLCLTFSRGPGSISSSICKKSSSSFSSKWGRRAPAGDESTRMRGGTDGRGRGGCTIFDPFFLLCLSLAFWDKAGELFESVLFAELLMIGDISVKL